MAQEKWLVDEPKVIDTGIVRALRVGLVGGQVDVVTHDEPTARVEIHQVSGKPIKVEIEGDTLTVDHPQMRWDDPLGFLKSFRGGGARADVSILVPRDVTVNLGAVSAGVLLSGTERGAMLNSVSGDVVVDGVIGDVTVNAVSGTTTIRDQVGAVALRTVSGDVVATGEIRRFTADAVSSAVVLDLHGSPDQVKVNTVSGSVDVRLEHGTAYSSTVATATGRLQFDDAEIRGTRGSYTRTDGELSGSYVDIRVNTVSGDVAIVHGPAPVPTAEATGTPGTAPDGGAGGTGSTAPSFDEQGGVA
ncbi:DUF4097 family beta strand repeat-containing protein [Curtobacterium aetherium]|uniref:DUF4097 family beta strand repeat protein n=1 Tax=Curtobacterium aetherium TaxID=2841594 RepID=A0ACD1E1F2_9MICO|nr:DUF4097 family beta strand repeat-containing protein [Curtobacterium sp. L6-1]QWS32669.1 DUF4097 family beta strand repeat protein [Curtobacterium sp. L6-1]